MAAGLLAIVPIKNWDIQVLDFYQGNEKCNK
jgi:hypothetical protein